MTTVTRSERMNYLYQEIMRHHLTEPALSPDADHNLTLSWPHNGSTVTIIIGDSISLSVTESGREVLSMNLTGLTDAAIIETIILYNLTKTKR